MKRPSSSASLFHLLSDHEKAASSGDDPPVMMQFLDGLDQEEDSMEELGHRAADKKRRLKVEQVRELEKSFEVENKLEPERKLKLALELGLQPRQVAIWFQNRRARWKTKQLEKDYNLLKSSYDTLVLKHANLKKEKESLGEKLLELKSKLKDEKSADGVRPIKEETVLEEETLAFETETKLSSKFLLPHNYESDSSAVMDDDNAGSDGYLDPMVMKLISPSASSSTTCLELSAMRVFAEDEEKGLYHHGDGLEGQDYLLSVEEETCTFFSQDHVSNVPWYMSQFNM